MVKKEKLYQRIANNQKNVRFKDFCALMTYFGFVEMRVSGSHHLYRHPNVQEVMSVQPQKSGQAKAYQVRQFLKLVDAYDLKLTDDDSQEDDKPEDKTDEQ